MATTEDRRAALKELLSEVAASGALFFLEGVKKGTIAPAAPLVPQFGELAENFIEHRQDLIAPVLDTKVKYI